MFRSVTDIWLATDAVNTVLGEFEKSDAEAYKKLKSTRGMEIRFNLK